MQNIKAKKQASDKHKQTSSIVFLELYLDDHVIVFPLSCFFVI